MVLRSIGLNFLDLLCKTIIIYENVSDFHMNFLEKPITLDKMLPKILIISIEFSLSKVDILIKVYKEVDLAFVVQN